MTEGLVGKVARMLASCASPSFSHHAGAPLSEARAVSPSNNDYYDPAPGSPRVLETHDMASTPTVSCRRILLAPLVPSALQEVPRSQDAIELIHFRPSTGGGDPKPLVLMSPILGNSLLLVDRFAKALARVGIHGVVVQRKDLAFHPEHSVRRAEEEVRSLVIRSRQALDHLVAQPDVDAERLGTFGISAGGIVSSMVAGAESRFRAHVWMLAGGPLPDVMMDTVEAEYRGYAREVLRHTPRTRSGLRRELREALRTDPLRLAAGMNPAGVLMVLARFDRSVPYRYGLALWRALGRPERLTSPLGHYSTFLLLPWLIERTVAHFDTHL